ncbi:LamG-like jellyroll fold domain-containing protein [Flindersiella endophytica]
MAANRRTLLYLTLLATVVLGVLAPLSSVRQATAAAPERPGLRGDYYLSSAPGAFDFGELKATVADPNLEFADLEGVFTELAGRNDDVTVRWTGRIQPTYDETYTFSMIGDNGFRLWVDGQLLIDNWLDNWDVEQVGTPIALRAGQKYDIKVEYFEHVGGSNLRLRWQSASQPKAIVPASALTLPDGFDPPGPYVAGLSAAGDSARLRFGAPLRAPLPANAPQHLGVTVAGTAWPVEAARLDAGDPSVLLLSLTYPIPAKAGNTIRTSYDGQGGLAYADGTMLEAYTRAFVTNDSTYTLGTRWTGDVDPNRPWQEYPRPQLVRDQWRNLNGRWQFAAADAGEAPPIGRTLAERIVVPYPVESTLSGLQRPEDRMWYRRTFSVPGTWKVGSARRLVLHFDAVDWQATVYVNGKQVTVHKGGYDRFSVDVTDALVRGSTQELVVGVYDPSDTARIAVGKQRINPGGIFYTTVSGIWQSVWMEPVAPAHITGLTTAPDVAGQALRLTVNAGGATAGQLAVATARDGNRVVGRVTGPVGTELRLPVPRPKLWSPDRPFLYDLTVTLAGGDRVDSYFGMRTVGIGTVAGTRQLLLNGKPVFQFGPLDQGFWPDGIYTPPTDEAMKYDLDQTKRLGFNAVRKHVKVENDRWYYWADRLGLLVWQDMPAMFGSSNTEERQQFETELRAMVDQHQASPSIVMWVTFNESWGQYDQARIADTVTAWDPTRLVDNMSGVNCCGSVDGGNGDVIDSHVYPGPGTPFAPSDTRASVLGEYGGLGMPVIGHTWSGGGWGYAVEPDPVALTNRYVSMAGRLRQLRSCQGLSAAIYTQTTDVESELNGLMTYDRALTKPIVADVRAANQAVIAASPTDPPTFPPGTPGLTGIGFWPFDEGSGTVAADQAGDHDATLVNGPAWVSGRSGSALQFAGSQSADTGAGILDTTGNYSVSAWVRLDSLGGFATAVSQDGDQNSAFFLQYSGEDNRFAFSFVGGRALAPIAPEPGRWYHLVGVRDAAAGQFKLYVDGAPAGTAANRCGEASAGHTVIGRGRYNGGPVDYWRGAIDQVHVYDRALTDAEVSALYAAGN